MQTEELSTKEPATDDDQAGGDQPAQQPMGMSRPAALAAIFVVSLAGLLLEVAYTRVISFKLWYYYTYLVIGLALLGLGSGATAVVLSKRLRGANTPAVLRWSSLLGALSVVVGYSVVAWIPIDTIALWDYGTGRSLRSFAALGVICIALFATFIAIGIIVATLLGRGGDDVGRLYFSDLIGAGIGCAVVVALISTVGPPSVIMFAAATLAALGAALSWNRSMAMRWGAVGVTALMVVLGVLGEDSLPTIRTEDAKVANEGAEASGWGPVFRVDVGPVPFSDDSLFLIHDGTWGSAIHRFDGDVDGLTRFDTDPRAWPFDVMGDPPERELIIGSAGGNENA